MLRRVFHRLEDSPNEFKRYVLVKEVGHRIYKYDLARAPSLRKLKRSVVEFHFAIPLRSATTNPSDALIFFLTHRGQTISHPHGITVRASR
jgi:hypothetical protein